MRLCIYAVHGPQICSLTKICTSTSSSSLGDEAACVHLRKEGASTGCQALPAAAPARVAHTDNPCRWQVENTTGEPWQQPH
eukprot:1396023-Amphidinium_carterae.1